jgi:predicted metal-dependent TIM-barrel fold hydrolase
MSQVLEPMIASLLLRLQEFCLFELNLFSTRKESLFVMMMSKKMMRQALGEIFKVLDSSQLPKKEESVEHQKFRNMLSTLSSEIYLLTLQPKSRTEVEIVLVNRLETWLFRGMTREFIISKRC